MSCTRASAACAWARPCWCRFPPHGSPDLRYPEECRYPEGAPLLRRTAHQDPLRGLGGAGRLAGRAAALRAEVRRGGAARPRRTALRGPRPRRGAAERRAVARQAGRGAAAAAPAARAPATAAHGRGRRGHLARVDRPVTQLALSGIAIEFGATRLLGDVTLTVARGERWGIIGRNGSGKTTLFRIITGETEPSAGTVARAGGLRYSVMEQHREF